MGLCADDGPSLAHHTDSWCVCVFDVCSSNTSRRLAVVTGGEHGHVSRLRTVACFSHFS